MKIIYFYTTSEDRLEIAVEDKKVVALAHFLESANTVKQFWVDGLNCSNQQKVYGCGDFRKWVSPIDGTFK